MTSQQMDVEEDIVDNDPVLRLRIVNLDYYLSEPNVGFDDIYSVFRQNPVNRVPVLRVFGTTDRGVKTCLHIHRVYPYLSIRFDAKLDDNYEIQKQEFMSQIVKQIESHLIPNKVRTRNNAKESPNQQLIYDIQEINSIPFYGFHDNYQKFLRIYFYNPSTVQKVSELLLSGNIMDRQIQPFEAHIPYTLQFLIDNNLYGMNFLDAKRVDYRKTEALDNNMSYSGVEPMSSCQLECDIDFKEILNRRIDITDQRLPGLEAIWTEQLKRCNNSQEVLNIKGVASQDRTDIASTNLEAYYMKRLFEGLSKLNLKQDVNQNMGSPQLSGSFADETDFAQMMVKCVDNDNESFTSDEISQTIEDVISSSQTLTINQTIEDVIISSQNDIISQTIEEVITDSQKLNKSRTKHKKTIRKSQTIRQLINSCSEQTDQELDNSGKVSNSCQPIEEETDCQSNPVFIDASTQTELKDSFDDSIDSVFGLGDEIQEIVCDCDSDECCDQCCDQGSDQCECDCERCEFEKCKRIPQLDGAYDSDDSVGPNYSPAYKEEEDDSDFEVGSKKKRTPKKGKRTKSTRTSPSKRKKTTAVNIDSDESDDAIVSTSKTSHRRRSRKKSTSDENSDDSTTFKSSSGRKVKSSEKMSEQLWDKFKPKDAKKARKDGSPIHVSFSESEGSDKEMKFNSLLNIKDFSYSPKKSPKKNDDNRSERSLTPYLSHESDEELPSKTKPGPRSSKTLETAKPGPKSSKAGPKSSKTAPKPGPKSSKMTPKPGPKSKKRDSFSSDPENDNFGSSGVGSRSRRATARAVNYDDTIERTTSFFSEEPTSKKRGQSTGKSKSVKSETESAIDSISEFISPIEDEVITADKEDDLYDENQYLNFSSKTELSWKSINGELLRIDTRYYENSTLDTLGKEILNLIPTPDYIVKPYLRRYEENIEYWNQFVADIQNGIESEVKLKTGTRSKGALKDFYTLPHLNVRKSTERAQNKTTASNTKSRANKSNEFARLVADASHILDKPLSKRGAAKPKSAESSASKTPATKVLPKRGNSSSGKSSNPKNGAKPNAKSQQLVTTSTRVKRGVTSSTIYNTISIPFYDSDIKVVTELTGAKKRAHLKSLCEDFELEVEKLPKHYLNNYRNHNISPFLFDNIYFNDYSGLLPEEQSNDTQDVLITTKNMINDVVSVFQCVDSVVSNVCAPYEPKPMIDTQEEDYFEESVAADETDNWDYGHYEEEETGIPVEGIAVDPSLEDNYDMSCDNQQKETEETEVFDSAANDPLSDALLKTFGDKEVDDHKEEEEEEEDQNNKTDEQNNSEVNELKSDDQNEDQQSTDCEQNEEHIEKTNDSTNDSPSEQNYPQNCSRNDVVDEDHCYDISAQPYSPDIQSNHYSNQTNGHYLEPNPVEYQQQNDYEEDESTDNSNSSASNQIIEPTEEHHFKLQSEYNPEMYGFNSQNQNMVFQNPIQNPIVPTLSSHNFQTPNVFSGPNTWVPDCPQSMPMQPQYSSMPTLNTTLPTQSDNEFDISTYNYMPYYNPNIPQMDGIFDDDDDIQTEGKPFNMRCSSDETIQQLSQGSRSEEASPKKHAADIVAEALRAGNSGIRQKTNACDERYGYYINGVVVKIAKSLPKQCLQQFGRECVPLEPLMNCQTSQRQYIDSEFTSEDCNSFFKTRLTGVSKFNYLHSLCNKNIRISLKRLNLSEIQFNYSNINFTNNSFISVSSLLNSNKNFVSLNNNKRLCVEKNESNLKTVVDSKSNASTLNKCLPTDALEIDEIPESPLNEISKCDDISEEVNEIYSFYSDNTLSPNLSQQSSQRSDQSIDEIPESGSSDYTYKQHSTPMNSLKCKPFSQTLTDTQKALDLSAKDSPNSSSKVFSQFSISEETIVSEKRVKIFTRNDSLIEGPTPSTTFDYEFSSVTDSPIDSDYEYQYLTAMSVEIHVSTRAKLNPDPKTDAIEVLFYSISCDRPPDPLQKRKYITGLIVVESELDTYDCSASFNVIKHKSINPGFRSVGDIKDICVDFADDEIVLLMKFVEIVKQYDPDIIVGYKIDTLSWGYILERANVLNMSILTPLSRINDEKYSRNIESTQNTKCELSGRITLNLWSIMRKELTLNQYNYENCHFHVLHERIPNFGFEKLTQLYANRLNLLNRRRVIDYYLRRTVGSLRLLDKLDFIGKTSELARLFGIQFQEVFNRGTQFRVEGIMLRFTKLMDYIAISPSPRQVATQKAPEILPLILEPESKYYTDPVVVLDFQSLYPSMMIAYNYCYSTCLGRVDQLIGENDFIDFGCFELEINKRLLFQYQNDIHISPNGVVFLKSNVRKGILPKMLEEILETRVMVKNAIKANNKKQFPNKGLNRKLDARQLGLKLIANVTYGYTSANYSGRMPCIDIADSIVAKGRETLERAINLVNSRPEWGAKVVYGDTDSLFVHFPGLSKDEAFLRGHEIAEAVTQQNPKPVRLKFEKVYFPCVLQTKKRYVGFSYESPEQQTPVFDAKGIETVRRDTCPAVAKMLEKSLKILFTTNDCNGVKHYLLRQFQKIITGRISILEDFVFAREYRGADNYSTKSHVPSAEIAKRRLAVDPRSEPKVKERVPYVVIAGAPNEQLFKLIKEPLDLIKDPSLRLNSQYYIEKAIIPALNRVFQLLGHNVNDWYREMPKKIHYQRYHYLLGRESKNERKTIPQFFNTTQCCVCDTNCKGNDFCDSCKQNKDVSITSIGDQIRDIQMKYSSVLNSCKQCSASTDSDIQCQSIECPNLFRYHQSRLDLMSANYLTNVVNKYF